ncbi:EamA family transporter [Candidatus Micrarchaeota archaeon]|nr:EamA family transporter [Candidatus Micrarchaeota archaeon]
MLSLDWFQYALLGAVSSSAFWIVCRAFLKNQEHHRAFALVMQFLPLVFLIPVLAVEPLALPQTQAGWLWLFLAGSVWAIQQIVVFKSLRFVDVSTREPLYRTKMVWAVALGILFLGETLTPRAGAGILLVFLGAMALVYRPGMRIDLGLGVQLVLLSAFLRGITYLSDKLALEHFSVTAYFFAVSIVSGTLMLLDPKTRREPVKAFFSSHAKTLAVISFVGIFGYWFNIKALSLGPVNGVASVGELSIVFTSLGGILFLGEKDHLLQKAAGAILALAGAFLLYS